MSFRKRNLPLSSSPSQPPASSATTSSPHHPVIPGTRPSPLDSRPTTSTGTPTVDALLAGHAGLPLGNSLLIEEDGTTDFAGVLVRFFASEGVLQGHKVFVVLGGGDIGAAEGGGERWGRDLPGLAAVVPQTHLGKQGDDDGGGAGQGVKKKEQAGGEKEKMKIAWRYERLGEFGGGGGGLAAGSRASPTPNRTLPVPSPASQASPSSAAPSIFCHCVESRTSPFASIIQILAHSLASSTTAAAPVHRLVIPGILSPAFYPPHASSPQHILQFLHSLRALLRKYPTQLVAMITLPLSLFPRSTGLVRWMEILSDGVLELAPFPSTYDAGPSLTTSGATTAQEDQPQGMVNVHKLPVFHEKGGAGGLAGDDLAFTVSRKKFAIRHFSLPPVEGDSDAQYGEVVVGGTKVDVDF